MLGGECLSLLCLVFGWIVPPANSCLALVSWDWLKLPHNDLRFLRDREEASFITFLTTLIHLKNFASSVSASFTAGLSLHFTCLIQSPTHLPNRVVSKGQWIENTCIPTGIQPYRRTNWQEEKSKAVYLTGRQTHKKTTSLEDLFEASSELGTALSQIVLIYYYMNYR